MFFWFVAGMHSGTSYPSGIFTRVGTGMGEIFYPYAGMGNLAGKILSHGYGYGIVPDGYIPIAIFNSDIKRCQHCLSGITGLSFCPEIKLSKMADGDLTTPPRRNMTHNRHHRRWHWQQAEHDFRLESIVTTVTCAIQ
jgi:hypothetical protein